MSREVAVLRVELRIGERMKFYFGGERNDEIESEYF
jgi:hypothetical protein